MDDNKLYETLADFTLNRDLIGLNEFNLIVAKKNSKTVYTDYELNNAWKCLGINITNINDYSSDSLLTMSWYYDRLKRHYSDQINVLDENLEEVYYFSDTGGGYVSFDLFGTLVKELATFERQFLSIISSNSLNIQNNFKLMASFHLFNNAFNFADLFKLNEICYRGSGTSFLADSFIEKFFRRNSNVIKIYESIPKSKKIITSDTYYSIDDVKKILKHLEIGEPDHIFLSSEVMNFKADGKIWEKIPNTCVHIGDNPVSDCVMIKSGIKGWLVESSNKRSSV